MIQPLGIPFDDRRAAGKRNHDAGTALAGAAIGAGRVICDSGLRWFSYHAHRACQVRPRAQTARKRLEALAAHTKWTGAEFTDVLKKATTIIPQRPLLRRAQRAYPQGECSAGIGDPAFSANSSNTGKSFMLDCDTTNDGGAVRLFPGRFEAAVCVS
jgi:hypothetical protein